MEKQLANVKMVFDQALEIDAPAERAAYLDQACADAPDLRQKVEALLRAYGDAGSFMQGPAPVGAGTIDEPPLTERPGTVIGPYKLLEQIGEGGFGVVFMAEQQHPVRRKVALKVVKPGMDTRQVVARFEAERQALALMNHPHIAHVFDGGETASGRPYFVMELVRGIPITDFCDQNHLPVRDRLELYVTVCQAVQHAHQKGIIHRDLKPSNILVTLHDDKPVVKVIDFGIAKATGQQLTEKTLFTKFAQMIGTPLYMSPEQAQMSGLDIDTRSDIYSLGVLLYELLTGTTPFDKERLRTAAYDEFLRIIREEEPAKPSTRISTLGQAATGVSAKRKSDPRRLAQLCRGELDWIVMKALEKDRNRRYESASAFAADVQRYLNDETVQACPPSAGYRLRKFARKYRMPVMVAAAFALLLLAGAAISAWQAVRATRAEGQAVENEGLARAAEESERTGRRRNAQLLYASDMALAGQLWESVDGSAQQVGELLAAHVPKQGEEDLRDFTWRYQWNLLHNSAATFQGDAGRPLSGALTLDGSLVTLHEGLQIRYWDRSNRRVTRSLSIPHDHTPPYALSPDGTMLALGMSDGTVRLLDPATGHVLRVLTGHTAAVLRVAFSENSKVLGTLGTDRTARLWNAATGGQVHVFEDFDPICMSFVVSSDGEMLAVNNQGGGAQVNKLSLYSKRTRQPNVLLQDRYTVIAVLTFSPDSRIVASGYGDGTFILWDTGTGKQLHKPVEAHSQIVLHLKFSPDGTILASSAMDGLVRLWSVEAVRPECVLKGHPAQLTFLAFSADGRALLTGSDDGTARLWDEPGIIREKLQSGSQERGSQEWARTVWSMAYSPDGRTLAIGSWGQVKLRDVRSGKYLYRLAMPGAQIRLAFSPDGSLLAVGTAAAQVIIWEVATGRQLEVFETPVDTAEPLKNCHVGSLTFSRDGKFIVAGFGAFFLGNPPHDAIIKVWEIGSQQEIATLRGHRNTVRALVFSPDGKTLASGSQDGTVKFWSVRDWRETRTWTVAGGTLEHMTIQGKPLTIRSVFGLAFSPNGETLAAGTIQGTVALWNVSESRADDELKGHRFGVNAVCFSPDGKTLATGSMDKTVRLWHLDSGREARVLTGHSHFVETVAFSPDGNTLASGGQDGRVMLWRTTSGPENAAWLAAERAEEAFEALLQGANLHVRQGQWDKAEAELDRAAKLMPDAPELWLGRGRLHAKQRQWDKALTDFARAIALRPEDPSPWYEQAMAHLGAGDPVAYGSVCASMLKQFRESKDRGVALYVAFTCLAAPNPMADMSQVVQFSEAASRGLPHSGVLGAALYRAGGYDAAIRSFEELAKVAKGRWETAWAWDWLFLAMAHHRLGHAAEARRYLEKAAARIDEADRDENRYADWAQQVEFQHLRKEAEALINPKT